MSLTRKKKHPYSTGRLKADKRQNLPAEDVPICSIATKKNKVVWDTAKIETHSMQEMDNRWYTNLICRQDSSEIVSKQWHTGDNLQRYG